jgi:thiol-disulfide isomerase/thioredoxin
MNKPRLALFCFILAAIIPLKAVIASEIGKKAPNCLLDTLGESEQVTINQLRGKVLYVDFWASWCPPCVKSFPFLNDLHHDFGDQGLHVLGINVDERLSDAQDFLAKIPNSFDVVTDPGQQCAQSFDVKAMPSSFLIDGDGVIRYVHLGFRSGDTNQLRAEIQKILEGATKS